MTCQGNVIIPEVPDGGVNHAVRGEGHDGTDDGTCEDIIPLNQSAGMRLTPWTRTWLTVVELVNSQSTTDEYGT